MIQVNGVCGEVATIGTNDEGELVVGIVDYISATAATIILNDEGRAALIKAAQNNLPSL